MCKFSILFYSISFYDFNAFFPSIISLFFFSPNFISRQNANILPCLTVERFFLVGFAYFFFLSFWLKMEVSFLQILFQTQLSILFGLIFFFYFLYQIFLYLCVNGEKEREWFRVHTYKLTEHQSRCVYKYMCVKMEIMQHVLLIVWL